MFIDFSEMRDLCRKYNQGDSDKDLLKRIVNGHTNTLTLIPPVYIDQPCMTVGENCFINYGLTILAGKGSRITLGNNVCVSSGVTFIVCDHPQNPLLLPEWIDIPQTLIIKNNVWIGANTTILGDLTIGENAVIGAGSVVTKNVPPGATVAGNPAKIIKLPKQYTVQTLGRG